jgi:hypothetical protein
MEPSRKTSFGATLEVKRGVLAPERVRALLASIPAHMRLTHFSNGERCRRRPEFEIGNRSRFREYLASKRYYWFHGDGYLLDMTRHPSLPEPDAVRIVPDDIKVYARSVQHGCEALNSLLPDFRRGEILYGCAGMIAEHDHRNSYAVRFVESSSGCMPGGGGLDYDRYVPGLYWLNVFPHEYISRHALDVRFLAVRTGGKIIEFDWGLVLRLYESPESWAEHADRIDQIIYETPGFFSKRRVSIPKTIHLRDTIDLSSELGKVWP